MIKPRPELLPPKAILAAAEVMALNEGKHPGQPWKTEYTAKDHVGALLRHCLKWLGGEKVDPETKKSHLIHAACRALMSAEVEVMQSYSNANNSVKATKEVEDALDSAAYWRQPCDSLRGVYDHLEEAPLPEPSDPQYDAWLEEMDKGFDESTICGWIHPKQFDAMVMPILDGWGSREVKTNVNGKPIDEYTPEEWGWAAKAVRDKGIGSTVYGSQEADKLTKQFWTDYVNHVEACWAEGNEINEQTKESPPLRYFPPVVAFDSKTRSPTDANPQTWPEGRI